MGEVLYFLGRLVTLLIGFILGAGSFVSLFRHPHWAVRNWEFPRVQIAVGALLCGAAYGRFFYKGTWLDWFFGLCVLLTLGWQTYRIFPYTSLAPKPVKDSKNDDPDASLRIITSNVLQGNRNFDRWLKVIGREDPDLILAVETDAVWEEALHPLEGKYPHIVKQVQSNKYGMILFSRLALENKAVRFLVQEDIPSIHACVILRNGERVRFFGVHPRPPEPVRDENATSRDAELIVAAREIREHPDPTIIVGDLNDVAWSKTTELFQKISGLLDPRLGRGFFNTFPASLPFLRVPLDHVFHANSFRLLELRILEKVGSDHLPVLIHLRLMPQTQAEQPEPAPEPEDKEIAQEKIRRARQEEGRQDSELQAPGTDPDGATPSSVEKEKGDAP